MISTSLVFTETTFSGQSMWSWTDGQVSCTGTSNWTGERVNGGGGSPSSTPLAVIAYATSVDSDLHIIDPNGFDHYVGGPTGSGAQLIPGSNSVPNAESWWVYLPGTYQVYIDNNTSGQMVYAVNSASVNPAGTTLLEESGTENGSQTPTWSFTIN